jgi:hypothetical protein
MMQLGNTFQGKKCARCRQAIQSDPAFADDLWYHRACLEEGQRALQRAQELAIRFGLETADSHTSGGVNKGTESFIEAVEHS